MLACAGTIMDEKRWSVNRYLGKGICPICHAVLVRTGKTTAICCPCNLRWTSTRIPEMFPSGSIKRHKETKP